MEKLEATSFEEAVAQLVPATERREHRVPAAAEGLHVCAACHSRLVYPMWCEAAIAAQPAPPTGV